MAGAKNKPGVNKKEGSINAGGLVIQNINIRPVQRTKTDVQNWRNNHQQAESINGTRVPLYDMYDDMLLDGFLKRLVAKRVLQVTKNKLKYIDAGNKEIDGAATLIGQRQFRKLRQRIQLHKAWGIAVIESMNDNGMLKIFDVPKKHIIPQEGKIVHEQYGVDGIFYREPPYSKTVIEIGDFDDLGYLLQACCYAIYKRGGIGDYANYLQMFGMPFREARYDGFNEQVRIQLENALEKAASAAWAVLPRDAEFTLHKDSSGGNSNDLYNSFRTAMNEEMMVTVLGATETTTSSKSSGYAQSETHKKTTDEVAQDDKEDELAILNEQVIPVMVALGLLQPGGKFVYDEPVDLDIAAKKVAMFEAAKRIGIPLSDDTFYEISGFPKPDNYDELKQKLEDEKIQSQQEADDEDKPAPGSKKPVPKKPGQPAKKKLSGFAQLRELLSFFD